MLRTLYFILFGVGMAGTAVLGTWYRQRLERRIVKLITRWATAQQLEVIELRPDTRKLTDFGWDTRTGDRVVIARFRRPDGELVTASVRCNTSIEGRYAGHVDVKYDQVRGFPVIALPVEQ